jgi:hypothetical protein
VSTKLNASLRAFSAMWELDGDYMRCRSCGRPQLASYASADFPHGDKCLTRHTNHPWQLLRGILARIGGAQ